MAEYPKLSIAVVTTYAAPIETDIAAYQAAGADGIGIWEYKLPEDGDDAPVLEAVAASGLKATLCCGMVPSVFADTFFTVPSDPTDRVKAMCASVERLAKFEPAAFLVVTGDPRSRDAEDMRRVTVEGLRTVAKVAADNGVTLGVEPYRQDAGSLVTTLPDAVGLIEEVGEPNVKIIADTWHFWDLPGIEDDLGRYVDHLVGVQVNDRREPFRGWADRRLPGDGFFDHRAFLGALDAAGYEGWFDVEVFSDDGRFGDDVKDSVWKRDPYEVARETVTTFRQLWDERKGTR